MNFNEFQDNIYQTVRDYVEILLSEFKCNKSTNGIVTAIKNADKGIYEVEINKVKVDCYSCNNDTYVVGDVVAIIILNNDRRAKYILSKMKH